MNVVSPARVSRLNDVFHCLNLKKRSSALVEPASAAAPAACVLLRGGDARQERAEPIALRPREDTGM